jgi:hypothetical protein
MDASDHGGYQVRPTRGQALRALLTRRAVMVGRDQVVPAPGAGAVPAAGRHAAVIRACCETLTSQPHANRCTEARFAGASGTGLMSPGPMTGDWFCAACGALYQVRGDRLEHPEPLCGGITPRMAAEILRHGDTRPHARPSAR